MSRTLFQITDDMHALDELLEELGGDISDPRVAETVDAWMAELDADLTRKVDNYAAFIRELEARCQVRRDEGRRLYDLARSDESKADWLKDRLCIALRQRGLQRVETPRYRVSVAANGGKQPLDIHDPKAVPKQFCQHIPESWDPDADLIRAELQAGREVPGVALMARGSHLRIK